MLKQVIENPVPFKPYFVESDATGERVVCTLTRNVWNKIGGAFFAYENQSVAVLEANECKNCGKWCMYPARYGDNEWCENCVPF